MVIDANTGETLYADQADEPRFPASLTKMMTLYLVFEQLETGRLTPSTRLKVSQEAASAQPTKLDLEPGEEIAVMDAVKALITKSANDMAVALAEAIGGTESRFAELMTRKARALGMRNTVFHNASGLPDPRQTTTAHDMLILALHLQDDFPKYYPLFALRAFSYNGSTHRNHNTMLNSYEGIDGIKTGYTRMSGFNLVTSLRRGDKHLVGAVFGGTTAGTRNLTMRMLLTRALLKASTRKTRKPAPTLVASAKPAARPDTRVAAVRPKAQVQQVASTQPATPTPAPLPSARRAPASPPQPEPETTAAASVAAMAEPAAIPIEIARVRPVMVAPRVRRTAFIVSPDPEEQSRPAPALNETPAAVAAATALQRSEAQTQPLAAIATTVEPAAVVPLTSARQLPQPVAATAAPRLPTWAVQRGTPPSSLQAQAQGLERGVQSPPTVAAQRVAYASTATAPAINRAATSHPAPAASGFHIQIGAFASVAEAERMLRETQSRSNGLLRAAKPLTAPVQKESRLLYRARFAGFSAQGAASTCLELRRAAIDCFVMKAE